MILYFDLQSAHPSFFYPYGIENADSASEVCNNHIPHSHSSQTIILLSPYPKHDPTLPLLIFLYHLILKVFDILIISLTQFSVQASFHQCVWSLHIVCCGSAVEAAIGHINGGDVVRLVHRYHGNDILTVLSKEYDKDVTLPLPKSIAL